MIREAYFAGGCFWCITPVFYEAGAVRVICGYSGGNEEAPTYAQVKAQHTGHRETICVRYETETLSYTQLLSIFLSNIDPLDADGQYIDRGHSYTTAIYPVNEAEKAQAEAAVTTLEESLGQPVCVAIEPFKTFYPAEEYHQDYYRKEPENFEQELIESGRKKL